MRLIDGQYLKTPYYGPCRMHTWLCGLGYKINRKCVQRLMRQMELEAIYPKPEPASLVRGIKYTPVF